MCPNSWATTGRCGCSGMPGGSSAFLGTELRRSGKVWLLYVCKVGTFGSISGPSLQQPRPPPSPASHKFWEKKTPSCPLCPTSLGIIRLHTGNTDSGEILSDWILSLIRRSLVKQDPSVEEVELETLRSKARRSQTKCSELRLRQFKTLGQRNSEKHSQQNP